MTDVKILPQVLALDLVGVYSPNIPNQERIYLRAVLDLNLGEYFMMTGWRGVIDDVAFPMTSDVLWLGNVNVSAGTWVIIYTGLGQMKVTRLTNGEPALVLHWGKPTTIFGLPDIVPVLVHIDAVKVGKQVRELPWPERKSVEGLR